MIGSKLFVLEVTGADTSAQNTIAEIPNKYLGNTMQSILQSVYLGPEYWSFVLRHAIYVKHRLPYVYIKKTTLEDLKGYTPNITHSRTFGCRVYIKKPGNKKAKIDHHSSNVTFIGYTATMKNICYIDNKTATIKIGVYILFYEAHFTALISKQPIEAQALQSLDFSTIRDKFQNKKFKSKYALKFNLNAEATALTKNTEK